MRFRSSACLLFTCVTCVFLLCVPGPNFRLYYPHFRIVRFPTLVLYLFRLFYLCFPIMRFRSCLSPVFRLFFSDFALGVFGPLFRVCYRWMATGTGVCEFFARLFPLPPFPNIVERAMRSIDRYWLTSSYFYSILTNPYRLEWFEGDRGYF